MQDLEKILAQQIRHIGNLTACMEKMRVEQKEMSENLANLVSMIIKITHTPANSNNPRGNNDRPLQTEKP